MNVKNVLINVLLMVMSVSVGLVLVEYALAYDSRHPNSNNFMHEVTLNGTRYKFLDTLEAINQPTGAVLIAGDSFTAGNACADNNTYPSAFTKAAMRSRSKLHAINMGVPGTGPISYALRIKDYLAEKGPTSGSIITLYANDVEIDCVACRLSPQWSHLGNLSSADREELTRLCAPCLQEQSESQRVAGRVNASRRINWWLAGQSRTYQLFREAGAKLAVGTGLLDVDWGRGAFPKRWRNLDGLHFKYIRAVIEFAKQEADRYRIPMMVVIYPDPMNMNAKNEYVEIYESGRTALTASTGVPVFSGYEAFLGNPEAEEDMPFSLTDTHPSCKAHAIFGEWVFAKWTSVDESRVH